MSKRRFNWPVAVVILIAIGVIVMTTFSLRQWQKDRMASSVFKTGLEAYESRDWDCAAINLGRYLVVDPSNIEILFKYAQSQLNRRPLRHNYVKQAVSSYRIILRNDNNNFDAAKKLSNLYLQMNIASEAELILERYLENNNNTDMQLTLVKALISQRKIEKASGLLQSIINADPSEIESYRALGELSSKFPEQFAQSPKYWFDLAIKKNPNDAMSYIIRGQFYLKDKQQLLASKDINKAESYISQNKDVILEFIKALITLNDFEKAQRYLLLLKERARDDLNFWQCWAVLALVSDNKDDMLMVAEEAVQNLYDPDKLDFMPLAVELLVNSNNFELANQYIKKLKDAGASPIDTLFVEGLLARRQNLDYKAIALFKKAIQMGDDSEKTYLALAMALTDVADNQSAIMQLNKMLLKNPESFKGHMLLTILLSRCGDLDLALEHSRLATQIMPGNLESTLLNLQIKMELMKVQQFSINENSWLEIEKKLDKIARSTGGLAEVNLTQVKLLIHLKKYVQAENIIEDLKKKYPNRVDVAISEIDLLIAKKEIEQAILKLYLIKKAFPQELDPVLRLVSLLSKEEKINDCQTLLTSAISSSKSLRDKRRLVLIFSKYCEDWNEPEKAFNMLSGISAKMPSDVSLKIELLKNARILGKNEETKRILDEIKSIESEQGWQWRCLQVGLWLEAEDFMSKYTQMINMMKENILLNPTDQISKLLLAKTYEKAGKLQLAITTYRDALNRSPKDIRIIIPAVIAMYKAGEYEQAGKILDYAMTSEDLKQKLAKFKLQNCIGKGDYVLAEDILNELLIQTPDDLTMNLFFCWLKMRQGELEEASEILENLTNEQKKTFSASAAMINLALLKNNKSKAITISDNIVSSFGNASAYILRAKTYSLIGENNLAIDSLNMAGNIEPDNVNVWITKGYLCLASRDFESAVESVEKALNLMPNDIQVKKHLVKVLLSCEIRKYRLRGIKLLNDCLSESPEDIQLRLYEAQYYLSKNTAPANKRARDVLQIIIEQSPRNFYIWAVLAETYLNEAKYGLAIESILKALSFSPGNSTLLILKAKVEAAYMPQLAVHTLKLIEQQYSGDISVVLTLAEMYSELSNFTQAINVLESYPLNNAYPQDKIRLNISLAKALFNDNQIQRCCELLNSLKKIADNDFEIFLARSELFIDSLNVESFLINFSNKFDLNADKIDMVIHFARNLSLLNTSKANIVAEQVLKMVLKKNDQSYKAKCLLADILLMNNHPDRAVQFYREILVAEPDNLVAINNLAWLICQQNGDYEQAFELTSRGLSYDPDYVDLIDTHGYLLLKSGQIQEAVANFNRCINLYPSNSKLLAVSHLHLADALVQLRQNTKAIKNLKEALKLNSSVGGLSALETSKARELLVKLSQENNYGKITN